MTPVSDTIIDEVLEAIESESFDYEKAVEEFSEQQPSLMSFLLSDHEGVLNEDEQDFQLYMSIVIWQSFKENKTALHEISTDEISEAEERNWAKFEETSSKPFQDRLDVFFDDYPEENLLALIEDALTGDIETDDLEESFNLTDEGQEPMFINLKTVIDVLGNVKN